MKEHVYLGILLQVALSETRYPIVMRDHEVLAVLQLEKGFTIFIRLSLDHLLDGYGDDILRVVQEDGTAKVTHIFYKVNLSNDRLMKYLNQPESSELLQFFEGGDRKMYRIAEKGNKFLMEFRRIKEFAEAFGLDI